MGLRSLYIFNSFSAGIDFGRQILTSKVDPRTVRVKVLKIIVCFVLQHGIGSDGKGCLGVSGECDKEHDHQTGGDVIFRESVSGKYVPRALMIDLEPTVIDEIKTGRTLILYQQ